MSRWSRMQENNLFSRQVIHPSSSAVSKENLKLRFVCFIYKNINKWPFQSTLVSLIWESPNQLDMWLSVAQQDEAGRPFSSFTLLSLSLWQAFNHTYNSLSFFPPILSISLSPSCRSSSRLLSPSLSLLNHDCRPNCVMVFVGTKLQLRAVRDISPEEEVPHEGNTTSAIDCDVASAFMFMFFVSDIYWMFSSAALIDGGTDASGCFEWRIT